jgi:hypothetical protein
VPCSAEKKNIAGNLSLFYGILLTAVSILSLPVLRLLAQLKGEFYIKFFTGIVSTTLSYTLTFFAVSLRKTWKPTHLFINFLNAKNINIIISRILIKINLLGSYFVDTEIM